MISKSRIWGVRRKALSGLEVLLEIVGFEVTMKGMRAGTSLESRGELAPVFGAVRVTLKLRHQMMCGSFCYNVASYEAGQLKIRRSTLNGGRETV